MIKNKNKILLVLVLLAFAVLLLIQISWIVKRAILEEKLFSQKVELALNATSKNIAQSHLLCDSMKYCVKNFECPHSLKRKKLGELDSLLKENLKAYNINIQYDFEVHNAQTSQKERLNQHCYTKNLEGILKDDGIELNIHFPEREIFILQQLGWMFFTSVFLMCFIFYVFFQTRKNYLKEQVVSERTRDFINNITHEFNTPLANINMANSLLQKSEAVAKSDKLLNYTRIIDSEKQRLLEHTQAILNLSKFEQNPNYCCNLEPTFPDQLIGQAIENFKLTIQARNGQIKLNSNSKNIQIPLNQTHFLNAICNIIDNAVKYSTTQPEIVIDTNVYDNYLEISLSDKGIGIPPADLPHVFERYFRVHTGDIHNVKGFGIGLTYVKRVVDEHCGTIRIESIVNKGTKVIIKLPLNSNQQNGKS